MIAMPRTSHESGESLWIVYQMEQKSKWHQNNGLS
uniref:Uncharacterized protein n=1 Tax=Rhizophora mucronata TaxID=61149 RepID=A0A2P2P5Y6_RHIMU